MADPLALLPHTIPARLKISVGRQSEESTHLNRLQCDTACARARLPKETKAHPRRYQSEEVQRAERAVEREAVSLVQIVDSVGAWWKREESSKAPAARWQPQRPPSVRGTPKEEPTCVQVVVTREHRRLGQHLGITRAIYGKERE